jgi:hypothetical protein
MKLDQVNNAMEHKIVGGSEHGWQCWPDARFLDYETEYGHASVVYSTSTLEIYSADVSLKKESWQDDHAPYRWINPLWKKAYDDEAHERSVDLSWAWDDIKWIDLEEAEDWLEKAEAIMRGEAWDNRIRVPIDLDDETAFELMKQAHERDITFNQMVELILREMILRKQDNGTNS